MSRAGSRASTALLAIAVVIALTAIVLRLLGYVERPTSMIAGAGAVMLLAMAARRRKGAG